MVPLKLQLYWKMPYFVKRWMAGRYARQWGRTRFCQHYYDRLKELAEHDGWRREQFAEYQREQLVRLVRHAAANVPYYRRLFSEHGIDPGAFRGLEDLSRLPILEKEPIRANPTDLVDDRLDPGKLLTLYTSGTSGKRLVLYRDAAQDADHYAFLDGRFHALAGMRGRRSRSVTIGGHAVADPKRTKPPFWVHNRVWNQIYMSSYHLSERYLGSYVEAIRHFAPEYIEGYPSSLSAVARYILDHKLPPLSIPAAFTSAEMLFDYQREAICQAFGSRLYNQYGCGEQAVFAAECEKGSMHLSPEFGIVEVVDEKGQPLPPGQVGQIVCTSLVNFVQPFIRYRLGDLVSLKEGLCQCGRALPMLGVIEGRADDALITRDGRRVGLAQLSRSFLDIAEVLDTQFIQEDIDRIRLRLVPSSNYTDAIGLAYVEALRRRVGETAEIKLELVDEIERTRFGKHRMIVSSLAMNGTQAQGPKAGQADRHDVV